MAIYNRFCIQNKMSTMEYNSMYRNDENISIYNKILDYVEEKQNSKIWPSNDLKDSPYNSFTCKLCGWQFDAQMYGTFAIDVDPYDNVKKIIIEHLAVRHNIRIPL